jgi:predicted O-methyltransferase YrrM
MSIVNIDSVCGAEKETCLFEPLFENGNMQPCEIRAIRALARARNPKNIFEFGTFNGKTTLNLVDSTKANVYTLDFSPDGVEPYAHGKILFHDSSPEVQSRIFPIYGNSHTVDLSALAGLMEFVFVDGDHSPLGVIVETRKALSLIPPSGGTIMWHDVWPTMVAPFNLVHLLSEIGLEVNLIKETALAYVDLWQ